jgi:hypothetical protein
MLWYRAGCAVTALLELAERCEQATANDAELFEDAYRAIFPKPKRIWVTDNTGDWTQEYSAWSERSWKHSDLLDAAGFLDAAIMLIPEGWRWVMREAAPDRRNKGERGFFARLETRDFESVTWGKGSDWITDRIAGQDVFCWAATPALAVCAAALRAIAMEAAKQGSTRSATARVRKDIAQTPSPNLSQGDTP